MKVPSIFDFERFSPFFAAYFEWRKSVDPKFSYRWLERRIASASYSMLAMIATGRRLPSMTLLKELAPVLNFESDELQYAELIVELEKSHNATTKEIIRAKMELLKPSSQGQQSSFDQMQYLGEWHHAAILEMFHLHDFISDPVWISRRLQGLVSVQQCLDSLALLKRLNLIRSDESGRNFRSENNVMPLTGASRLAKKNYHKQFLDRAKEAVLSQDSNNQHLSVSVITISTENIPLITREIDEFVEHLTQKFGSDIGNATYQFSLQFLRLTTAEEGSTPESERTVSSPIDRPSEDLL